MQAKLEFRGTGGELFKELIVGALLTGITLGIYAPWHIVSFHRYLYAKTKLKSPAGDFNLSFTGTGGELFKVFLIGGLLSSITLGIYLPWFLVNLIRFFQNHAIAKNRDGESHQMLTSITGGELFKAWFVGALLTGITLGIYGPWFLVNLQKLFASRTHLVKEGRELGTVSFTASGGDLFVQMLVGAILMSVTFGIYSAWYHVKMLKFFALHTEIEIQGRKYRGDFTGTGGEYFVLNLVGILLSMLTLGIYTFWFMAKLLRFQFDNTVYADLPAATPSMQPAMILPAGA